MVKKYRFDGYELLSHRFSAALCKKTGLSAMTQTTLTGSKPYMQKIAVQAFRSAFDVPSVCF
jgi:hypothetical protein